MAGHGGLGLRHIHKRKRHRLKQFPHPHPGIRFLDKLLLAVAFAAPLVTLTQAVQIWTEKDATGVSLITWAFYAAIAIPWAVYGVVHKSKPILITYSLYFLVEMAIVVGIIKYA
jgi:uncharacterized protein with PQ loop repeat